MKVTKLIREYVIDSVKKAIPTTNLCPEYDIAIDNADKICKILEDEIRELYEKRVKELKVEYPIPEDFKVSYNSYVNYSCYNSEVRKQRDSLILKAERERNEKTKEILLSLELGANRDELNRMIDSLCKTEE